MNSNKIKERIKLNCNLFCRKNFEFLSFLNLSTLYKVVKKCCLRANSC